MTKNVTTFENIKNSTVLLRLDLNEQVNAKQQPIDSFRLQAVLPTINKLRSHNNRVIVASHLGRPNDGFSDKLSLKEIAKKLAEYLDLKFIETDKIVPTYPIPHLIFFTGDVRKSQNRKIIKSISTSHLIVLENIRFYPEEETNDQQFAKQLAELADIYINDAFSVTHHPASSLVGITKFLPSLAGPLLKQELASLDFLLKGKTQKPFVLVVGGVKIEDKAKTLLNLGRRADQILIGGGLANLMLHMKGYDVNVAGATKSSKGIVQELLLNFHNKIVLPQDVVVLSTRKKHNSFILIKDLPEIVQSDGIFDIGSKTILEFSKILRSAKTICWNGPMGRCEDKQFRTGTLALAKVMGGVGKRKAFVLAGGGETVASIYLAGQQDHFDHISTGGGAMLSYLAGNKLPGISALS